MIMMKSLLLMAMTVLSWIYSDILPINIFLTVIAIQAVILDVDKWRRKKLKIQR